MASRSGVPQVFLRAGGNTAVAPPSFCGVALAGHPICTIKSNRTHRIEALSRAFTMHKPFQISMRLLFVILALVAVLCFAGPFGWPRLGLAALSLITMGACLGVLVVLLPWVRR